MHLPKNDNLHLRHLIRRHIEYSLKYLHSINSFLNTNFNELQSFQIWKNVYFFDFSKSSKHTPLVVFMDIDEIRIGLLLHSPDRAIPGVNRVRRGD